MGGWHSDMFTTQFVSVEDATSGLAVYFNNAWVARIGYPSVNYAKHAGGSQGRIGATQFGPVAFVLFVLETEP